MIVKYSRFVVKFEYKGNPFRYSKVYTTGRFKTEEEAIERAIDLEKHNPDIAKAWVVKDYFYFDTSKAKAKA